MPSNDQLSVHTFSRRFATSREEEIAFPLRVTGNSRAETSSASRLLLRTHLELVGRSEASDRPAGTDYADQPGSRPGGSRRSNRLLAVMGGFVASCQATLGGLLVAAMSWMIAQILAGCVEYCEALYPTFIEADQGDNSIEARSGSQSVPSGAGRLASRGERCE